MKKCTVTKNKPSNPITSSVPTNEKKEDGQFKDHWVICEEDRKKGHIRPVREVYIHEKCGTETRMPLACAETYAKNPNYYGSTFCCACKDYFPVGANGEFIWTDDKTKVGT